MVKEQETMVAVPETQNKVDFSKAWDKTQSFRTLTKLAKRPLHIKDLLTPDRLGSYRIQTPFFDYLYGCQRVDDAVLEELQTLSDTLKLTSNFEAQQRGAPMNQVLGYPSENRAALHTAQRACWVPNATQFAPEATLAQARETFQRLKRFLDANTERFSELVVLGIGGSELGPRALLDALRPCANAHPRTVHFLANVDPEDCVSICRNIKDPKKVLVAVVSKSGSTLETHTNEAALFDMMFKPAGLSKREHFVTVTQPESPLDNLQVYLDCFHMPQDVGGRFSPTSAVGGLVLGFAFGFGLFEELLVGAHDMDCRGLDPNIRNNIPLLSALLTVWNRNFLNQGSWAIIPYSSCLLYYVAHLQQLLMESNGKLIRRDGQPLWNGEPHTTPRYKTCPVVFGRRGTNAQHSFFQMLHQHPATDVFVEFIGFVQSITKQDPHQAQQKLLSNLLAQAVGLAIGRPSDNPNKVFPGNRPSSIIIGNTLTPKVMGALLAYHEAVTTYLGTIWGINSFDQEGVQLGKELANTIISTLKTTEQPLTKDHIPSLLEQLWQTLKQ